MTPETWPRTDGPRTAARDSWPPALVPADRPRRAGHEPLASALLRGELPAPPALPGVSPQDVLTACVAALLHRLTGQDRIALALERPGTAPEFAGFAVTGRPALADLAAGRVTISVAPEEGTPPVGLRITDGTDGTDAPGSSAPAPAPAHELHLTVHPRGDGWITELRYDERLFDRETVQRLADHLVTLTTDAARTPDRLVALLRLLTAEQTRHTLVEWNRTAVLLPDKACLHDAFEERAAREPGAVALIQGERQWTYGEINASANRLAHHLREAGVAPDTRVGLCLERSASLLTGVLGILKAGGAYVPLDPDYPAKRLATMLDGTSCAVVVTDTARAAALPATQTPRPLVLLDTDMDALARHPAHDPVPAAGPDNLCYIIHTSGSTGQPKPIALRHRGVVNNLADLNSRYTVGDQDRVLALSSPSFDMSVYEFLGITAAGGTVVVPDPERAKDVAHWARLLVERDITVWNSAPALLELLTDHLERTGHGRLGHLRLIMLGGDWIPVRLPDRIRAFTGHVRFIALGGATEASIHSTVYEVEKTDPDWTSIPYGRPMANQRTYILDDFLQPVPPGVAGELHLAGTGLARGYLERPELTGERFLDWSYDGVSDRLYRTGDLARHRPDGLIELLGRKDFQVKIHGLRVELTEIEAVLRGHEAVKDAAAAAVTSAAGGSRLVGYAVPHPGRAPRPEELRAHLAQLLPAFMVPGSVRVLDAMPLNANGKLDRKALTALAPEVPAADLPGAPEPAQLPVGAWEQRIAAVWQETLRTGPVGRDSDFFALGGDSMSAQRCLPGIDPELRWAELYKYSTVRALAAHLTARGRTPAGP
ncbi:amino acid adenylation domain-containing protein [Streptomyces sp. R35]|uniref:Amino acid adenylation domain-containing protein n=1 Tax=Streptomyces sp. R35 TaxID=3238630 RepID=A0AB39SHW8_9ACTN